MPYDPSRPVRTTLQQAVSKNGKTKEKIARVSGADLDLYEHSLTLEIRGTDDERKRAKKCALTGQPKKLAANKAHRLFLFCLRRHVECVMAQRVGPVTIEDNNNEDDDLTVIQVPSEAVGFVTGSQGNFLRVEEEWGTLMFFADFRGRGERQEVQLAFLLPNLPPPPPAEREREGNPTSRPRPRTRTSPRAPASHRLRLLRHSSSSRTSMRLMPMTP